MTRIEHYVVQVCPACGGQFNGSSAWHRGDCSLRERMTHVKEVEVVPTAQLRGAVDIIRALVAANDTPDGAIGEVRSALGERHAEQLRAILAQDGERPR